jgi:hypothetical protein
VNLFRRHESAVRAVFSLPSPVAWAVLGGVLLVDIVWFAAAGHSLSANSLSRLGLVLAAFALLSAFCLYGRDRADLRGIVAWASATLFFVPFSLASFVLSYLASSLGRPLIDAQLAAVDHALGFDWPGFLFWVNAHPAFGRLLVNVYFLLFPELTLAILILGLTKRIEALRELVDLYWMTMLATLLISTLLPAAGAYLFHMPPPAFHDALDPDAGIWHLHDLQRLRDGSFHVFDLNAMQGIIVFPSFHTALAILVAWSLRSLHWIRWPATLLSGLIVVSTLPEGGHHLADVLGGAALVAAAVAARRHLSRRGASPATELPVPA